MYKYLKIIIPLAVLIALLITAVFGFSYFEHLNRFEALWMMVTTVLTIGYGDMIPATYEGRILAILLVPVCIILFTYFMGLIIGRLIEINISAQKRSKIMLKKIKRLNRHIIICGLNPMSGVIIERIAQEGRDIVLIDPDENKTEAYIEKFNVVIGDPCEDDVLKNAGIEKASGLITTRTDAENVLIVLSAREMAPDIKITSSAERIESESKLLKAGADRVINPERIGGTRMALSILKPAAIDYIDRAFTAENESFKVNELFISEGSSLVGATIRNAEIRNRYDLSVMAVNRDGRIHTSNLADFQLEAHDTLIVFGKEENLEKFIDKTLTDQI